MNVRVRFAPSPTGYLHIGGLRTALYNYVFAKKHGGVFVLRIEDTDRERFVEGGTEDLIQTLARVGIEIDEGPKLEQGKLVDLGASGPYIQSQRLEIYKKYAKKLLDQGNAYHCFCSKAELDSVRNEQQKLKQPTRYNRHCLRLSPEEVSKKLELNEPYVIRMKVPEGQTTFKDLIRGNITISNTEIDDQVILKSDGFPTYHLAVVVDDHLMKISHVIRGEEWISSVPKHVILHKMLDFDLPEYAHLPLLLNADKSKLSKRQGDVAVEDYLEKGYLPEALLNFVALLGYNPKSDQEIYSMDEYASLFKIEKVNAGGAVVNFAKLDWMNKEYIKKKNTDQLVQLCMPFIKQAGASIDPKNLVKILAVEKERMTTLADIVERLDIYYGNFEYNAQMLVWKKADEADAKANLESLLKFMGDLKEGEFGKIELVENKIKGYIKDNKLQNGNVLWPLRVALSGQSQSPSPFELAWVLGKDTVLQRVKIAINKLS